MTSAALDRLLALRNGARDGSLLRMSIATQMITDGNSSHAIDELRRAVEFDPHYSAAWKLLGKLLADAGLAKEAIAAYRTLIPWLRHRYKLIALPV